jgi:hypothetical protein
MPVEGFGATGPSAPPAQDPPQISY